MTTPLTLRADKGAPLTHDEVDGNFTALRATADAGIRTLTANLDLYVRADGNDSNDGLTNTAGGAKATPRGAYQEALKFAPGVYAITIRVGPGTYADPPGYSDTLWTGVAAMGMKTLFVTLIGDPSTPANVVMTDLVGVFMASVKFDGFTFSGRLFATFASLYVKNSVLASVEASFAGQVYVENCAINADPLYGQAFYAAGGVAQSYQLTVNGTRNYSNAFAVAEDCGVIYFYDQPVVAGSVTGKRFDASCNGVIKTYGGGANYLPGSVAGTTATGGQYA